MDNLLQLVQSKAQAWLDSPVIDDATKAEVKTVLSKTDSKELIDNFYKDLEFGTGGLRGVMGAGSNSEMLLLTSRTIESVGLIMASVAAPGLKQSTYGGGSPPCSRLALQLVA